jgi:hypothetical protein
MGTKTLEVVRDESGIGGGGKYCGGNGAQLDCNNGRIKVFNHEA